MPIARLVVAVIVVLSGRVGLAEDAKALVKAGENDAKPQAAVKAPFPYVWGKAFHVLPETHNNESGYFSLSEGVDGKIHVGTAKYGDNAYLVEFDPKTEKQRVLIDVHKVCGLTARGYAAQAKIHTRNYVGPSGVVYVGSKQGYPLDKHDTAKYPGGYIITHDPKTGATRNHGMPFKEQGVADVLADELRGLLYVVTCEDQHWMLHDLKANADVPAEQKKYRELGPMLTPYATTLIDGKGRANAITKDFQLAQYDPETKKVTTRPILVRHAGAADAAGQKWTRANTSAIPTWNLAADGRTAYLILMNDPTLLAIDLHSEGETVAAASHGKLIEGKNPDSRCALTIEPVRKDDKGNVIGGRIYALVRVDNETGYGKGYLHHLLRFDPKTNKQENLGVLVVKNPDFFDWNKKLPDGKPWPWTHGFHKLPDGALTPLHAHMALLAGRDGSIWATIIYPFALVKVDPIP